MEVTTVSPPPASPTAGGDLCEIDVTNVAIHSVTLLICLCGLAGNGAFLCFTSLKDRNADFFYVALIDFIFLLFTVPSTFLFLVEDISCSPIVPLLYFSFLFQLSSISYYWLLFRLMPFSSVVKIFKLLCHRYLSKRLLWLVYGVQFWAFYALFLVIPALTHLCRSHKQQHCRAALISMYAVILLLWAATMVIYRKIGFIRVKWVSKKQQPERREIVISLIVLFTLLLSLYNFLRDLSYIVVSSHVVFLLNCTHSSIKPFIYFLAGRCWSPCALSSLRLSLQRVFDEQVEVAAPSNVVPKDTGV